ncbi:hypothetical protein GOP47_0004776 [Adiantum capillus-veneris]|uniref:Rieske domain-containing protein n=1 Tax=Adiantum capillus-veneris TaxID=13818 RepID=A0A9D4ZMK7_ADICA|nr:hypothetical protein GOP47_0004776 [Adiantum capillus-veneris]
MASTDAPDDKIQSSKLSSHTVLTKGVEALCFRGGEGTHCSKGPEVRIPSSGRNELLRLLHTELQELNYIISTTALDRREEHFSCILLHARAALNHAHAHPALVKGSLALEGCKAIFGKAAGLSSFATMATPQAEQASDQKFNEGLYGLRHTVWNQQDLRPIYPKISKDEATDVVVVGAGISGLSTAYNLVKEGKKVVVLEAKARGSGMTGRTTAHIMTWNDDYYYKIAKQHGIEVCKIVGESHRAAIDFVARTVDEEGIYCKFAKVDGYLFPHEDSDEALGILKEELEASKLAGFDVKMVDLAGDPACGKIGNAIQFPGNGDFHPLMYINGLAEAIVRRGGKIYEQSRVSKNEAHKVTTEDGVTVTAESVVLATLSPLNHNLAIHARQEAQRTYVLGFKVKKGSVKKAQWWDTNEPYHYIRIEEREGFDVLIVGGNDNATGMPAKDYMKSTPFSSLEKWARQRWTAADEVIYQWTGQVYEPIDSLHLIGPDPNPASSTDVYVVTGDSGQGMTGGTIAGILIKDLILKRENRWAKVYSPSRLPPFDKSTASAAVDIAEHTMRGYASKSPVICIDAIDIEDLLPDTGAIKQDGLHKVAIYKDKHGGLHKYSAVCPHMKCIVQWNPIDKSWDCPCHGSIFDAFGRCVDGPAKADLSPMPLS